MANTGKKIYNNLQQVYVDTGLPTEEDTKPNDPDDPDYISPTIDTTTCPPPIPPEQQINKLSIKFTNNTSQTVALSGVVLRAESIADLSQAYYQAVNFSLFKNTNFTAPLKNQLDDITRLTAFVQGLSLNIRTRVTIGYQRASESSATQIAQFNIVTGDNIALPLSTLRESGNGTNQLFITFTDNPLIPPDNHPPNVSIVEGTSLSIVAPIDNIIITGSATDPDVGGTVVSTQWSQVSGPSPAIIESPNSLQSKFSGLSQQGTYVFKFTATDNYGVSSSINCSVLVKPPVANPNGLINVYVDSLMPDNTIEITQIALRNGAGNITNLLTSSNINKDSGNVIINPLKGTYTILVTIAGSISTRSLKVQWATGSVIINTTIAGTYAFDNVVVDEGISGVLVNLKAGQTDTPTFPITYIQKTLGLTATETANTLPNGRTETVTGDVTVNFYSDSAGTTSTTFTGSIGVRTNVTDNIQSTTIVSFGIVTATGEESSIIATLRSFKEWNWTLNNSSVEEDPADKIIDSSYTYDLLPGQGYLIIS